MKITLKHLKTRWDNERLERIRNGGVFYIGSSRILQVAGYCDLLDAVWGKNFNFLLKERNRLSEWAKHIFVSQMCDIAVEEYTTVCKLLRIKIINLVGSKTFYQDSKRLLSKIPNVKIYWMNR